jgi:hypothetical protein
MNVRVKWLACCVLAFSLRATAQNTTATTLAVGSGSQFQVSSTGETTIGTSYGGPLLQIDQLGSGYSGGVSTPALLLSTQNPTLTSNYLLSGSTPSGTAFSIRADGQAYYAGYVGIGTTSPIAPLDIATGYVSAGNQVYNALTLQPSGGSGGYGNNGASIFLDSLTNSGINPVAGIWSSLEDGGSSGDSYAGALVLGSTIEGSTAPAERMRITGRGNVGIGTTTPAATLEVSGTAQVDGSLSANGGIIFPNNGGTQTTAWTGVLCGGDYAESVDVTGSRTAYEPGDVMVVDPVSPGSFLKSSEPYSTLVAGIYSTKPGAVGRRFTDAERAKDAVPMAMVGIVPTKVSTENGPVKPGDLLVTSSKPGYAMRGTDRERISGAIVGKALGSVQSGTGVIEVLVTLQ